MDTASLINREFVLEDDIIYLNHAAVSPWPTRTRDAVKAFADENSRLGSQRYLNWLDVESRLRKQLQSLINAPSCDDIALVKNTSEALSMVAYGIEWQPGDNIVISNQEFPSNHVVWESLGCRGVELRLADIETANDSTPEQSLFNMCDSRTRLISISSVQYATGLKMDLERIGQFCKAEKILFCIDAIQSVGAAKFDIQCYHADFAMADGHKWMLGPEGLGFFYCAEHMRDQLQLNQYGWHMMENYGDYSTDNWQVAKSARRFECGSPNMLGIHALSASLSLILDIGISEIEHRIQTNTQLMLDEISQHGQLELISPSSLERLAGIVTFKPGQGKTKELFEYLKQQNVMCAERGGGIRFSPHFYSSQKKIQTAIDMASDYSS